MIVVVYGRYGIIRQKPMQGEEKAGLYWTSKSHLPAYLIPNEASHKQETEAR